MSELQRTKDSRERIMALSAGGIFLALAEILSLIKVVEMPQGGSVTPASMLPIILFALCFGPGYGLALAFVYSLLQTFIGGILMSFPQALLDYTVAFTGLGLAGFFAAKKSIRTAETNMIRRLRLIPIPKIILGTVVAILVRMLSSFLAGIVFWAEYTPEGQTVWGYSLAYNASYLIPETCITLFILFSLMVTLLFQKKEKNEMTPLLWLVTVLVSLVPIFGQIFLVVWMFDKNSPRSRKVYCGVFLGVIAVLFLVWLVISIIGRAPYIPFT